MRHAVLANRSLAKSEAIFEPLLDLLRSFHDAKDDRECQSMLHRLWQPLLWRHLKVANSVVRRNASEIFLAAFPIEDYCLKVEERSAELEKQCQVGKLPKANRENGHDHKFGFFFCR